MYIIVIAWLYVVILMAATEKNLTSGILTFLFYGLIPCALFLWILGAKHRRFKKKSKQNNCLLEDEFSQPNTTDTHSNQ